MASKPVSWFLAIAVAIAGCMDETPRRANSPASLEDGPPAVAGDASGPSVGGSQDGSTVRGDSRQANPEGGPASDSGGGGSSGSNDGASSDGGGGNPGKAPDQILDPGQWSSFKGKQQLSSNETRVIALRCGQSYAPKSLEVTGSGTLVLRPYTEGGNCGGAAPVFNGSSNTAVGLSFPGQATASNRASARVRIVGFRFRNFTRAAIDLTGASAIEIDSITVDGSGGYGIYGSSNSNASLAVPFNKLAGAMSSGQGPAASKADAGTTIKSSTFTNIKKSGNGEGSAILIQQRTNVTIRDNTIRNAAHTGVDLKRVSRVVVRGNDISDVGKAGIGVGIPVAPSVSAFGVRIVDNDIKNYLKNASSNDNGGIYLWDAMPWVAFVWPKPKNTPNPQVAKVKNQNSKVTLPGTSQCTNPGEKPAGTGPQHYSNWIRDNRLRNDVANKNDGFRIGIYLDDLVKGVYVADNTLTNSGRAALYLHNTRCINAENNTFVEDFSYKWNNITPRFVMLYSSHQVLSWWYAVFPNVKFPVDHNRIADNILDARSGNSGKVNFTFFWTKDGGKYNGDPNRWKIGKSGSPPMRYSLLGNTMKGLKNQSSYVYQFDKRIKPTGASANGLMYDGGGNKWPL